MTDTGPGSRNIAIFDGDNTLWDTNAVFTDAQKNILRDLKEARFQADSERDFALLRKVDDLLIKHFGKREYDITYLPLCLMRHFKGEPVEDVNQVAKIVANSEASELTLAQTLGSEFNASLKRLPNLFPDVIESLSSIRQAGRTVMVLYSEGMEARLKRICDHYNMSTYFHDIILGNKSVEDWFKTKERAVKVFKEVFSRARKQPRIYVIGDLLERDIRPGNLIGARTIYKPGGYRGVETPQDKEHTPSMTISSMKELLDVL